MLESIPIAARDSKYSSCRFGGDGLKDDVRVPREVKIECVPQWVGAIAVWQRELDELPGRMHPGIRAPGC